MLCQAFYRSSLLTGFTTLPDVVTTGLLLFRFGASTLRLFRVKMFGLPSATVNWYSISIDNFLFLSVWNFNLIGFIWQLFSMNSPSDVFRSRLQITWSRSSLGSYCCWYPLTWCLFSITYWFGCNGILKDGLTWRSW